MQKEVLSREALRNLQEPVLAFFAAIGLFVSINVWKMQLSEVMILIFLLVRLLGLLNKSLQRYQFLLVNRSAFEVRRSGAVCQLWSAKCRDVHTSHFVRVRERYQTAILYKPPHTAVVGG